MWAEEHRAGLVIDHQAIVAGLRSFLSEIRGVVLTYRPMPGEVDLDPLLASFECAITRTWPGGRLSVHGADVVLERHRYGYLQPVATAPELDLSLVAVALVPGMLFDRAGIRLGHGAGYFDRLLARLPGIALVGVSPGELVVDQLPVEPHDIGMTHLATEAGVTAVASPR